LNVKLENVAIANALQLEAAWRRASRSGLLLDNFVLHMPQTAISQLPVKMLTSPLHSATSIS